MADINKIIDELLLELSVTYPFPNMKDREQVFALLEICDELGYGHLKPILEEMFINEAEPEKESGLFAGKFHLGGGYYSSKDGGEAEFKNDKGNLRPITPEEKAKFDSKGGKAPSAEKPTDAPKPNQPSPETPSVEKPKDASVEAPAPMKTAPVVKTPGDVLKSKVEKWSEKEKEFFKKGEDKPGSPTRRSFGDALKDKVKGARNAIAHGFKHEVHTFKAAGAAVKNLVSGKPLEKEQKKALISVGIKVASTALFAAAGGGLAHGAAYFAKHVAMELIPHAVAETIIVGVGRASLFAGADGDDERMLADFMDAVAENMENMDIPEELMMSMVDSYNEKKKPNEPQSEVIDLNELFNRILNEEDGKGESKEFPGKFHLGGGYYSSKDGGQAELKNDKGSLRPLTDKEKAELSKGDGGAEEPTDGESDSDKPDTASMIDTATKALDTKEKEAEKTLPKDNPDLVLDDPKASTQNKAKARAFKSQQTIDKNKQEDSGKGTIGEPTRLESANEDTDSKVQKFKGKKSGKEIQTIEFEDGGMMFGTVHGETKMVDDIIDQIKATIPQEEWENIVFLGEGGATNDEGDLEFNDEMDYAAPRFEKLGAGIDTWDGDDLDVHNDQSKLYKKQMEKTGLNDSQVKAGNWASMIGQGEGTDTMSPKDFLDDEGRKFLEDAVKEAGFPPIENFDNPTGEVPDEENPEGSGDRGTLFRLAFPEDNGDKETKINDIQVAFNDTRDENIIEKRKELVAKGKIPIVIAGESHVELVDKMMQKGSEKKTETKQVEPQKVAEEMPEADKETFSKDGKALDGISPNDLNQFNTDISKITKMLDDAKAKGEPAPDINLCDITIPGTNLYCDDNKGIPREEMPQFKGKAVEGSRAAGMGTDKDGEVDTEPVFREMLKEKNIKVLQTEVPADKLKATQKDLVGGKVIGMMGALEKDPNHPKITAPIYVSRDGYVIDGHHRWAAIVAHNAKNPNNPIPMKSTVIDMDIKDAIPMANKFAEDMGIAAKKADVKDGELPKPKEPNEKEGGVIYPLGGGYYSDTKGGTAQYMKSESVVNKVFIEENIKFIHLLFEENLTMKTPSGKEVMVKAIDVKDQPEANKEVENAKEEAPNVDVATAKTNLQISDGKTASRIKEASKWIDSSDADEETKQILKDTVSKILKGEDVDPANSEIASKWLSVRAGGGNDIGIYIAQKEGDFKSKSRKKITLDIDPKKVQDIDSASDEWNDTVMNKYGLSITTQTGAYVNKKDWTANKMNKKRKKVKFEVSENGNSVTVEGITYTKRPVPDTKTLVEQTNLSEQFIKQGSSEAEANEEARKVISAIERGNTMVDKLSKDGEMEVVDYGPTDTNDNRKKTLKNTIDKTRKSILKSIKKYSGLSEEEILEKYADLFKSIDEIEKSAPINNPNWDSMSAEEKEKASNEYLGKLTDVLQNIRRDKDIASGGPDIAEVLVFMNEIGKGNQAFLPSSSNFPTVDIVSFNQQKTPPENATPEELAEFYANEYSANSVSFIDSDAESIKLGKGGASAGPSKTDGSTFNNEKTKEVLDSMMDSYHAIYGDYPPSKEAIDKAEEGYKAQRAHMIEILIGQGKSPEQAERMVSDVETKATDGENSAYQQAKNSYQNSLGKEEMDPEFDRGLKLYNKTGMLFEMMFNEDVKSNNFGNVRFVESGTGARTRISMEVLDGINEKCCVKFNPNPGELKIKGDASGKRKAGINVSYSTWIVKCKK
jgi:hypothetical protein